MFWQSALAAALFGMHAHAGIDGMASSGGMMAERDTDQLEQRMAAMMGDSLGSIDNPSLGFAKRETANSSVASDVILNADGTIDMTAWDATVEAACVSALSKLAQSSNPSGACTCYNLLVLNNATGTFEADLRLYQLSAARDEFAGIAPDKIMVGLSYTGASVSPVSTGTTSSNISARQAAANMTMATTNSDLKLLQTYMFVGQIKKEALTGNLTMAALEALVMPIVTLTGINSTGSTVSTNVSSNEASFVAGIFSDQVVLSKSAIAAVAVSAIIEELHNGTVAFVLPGVQLILFPVGLIITSIWLVIGVAFIGFGTYERINYREQYNRRTTNADRPAPNRI
ncbi:hypothetical protein CMQ_2207 [Grosmannia clavigera kw1407]|uniref:Uncharacterized protein n=1 Tax=Grosmannia clavigera (strain kw1407 / UAMH 11150) TaxID=655863 RepID=F0XIZ9_GROCL|nr:uncharacterized protein CMQ_2207 [Grosmannia clavigera kw1407]EFX02158.1 hypothetical protein CMQ_2207 [Grosmannia clavigera kw1407]